MNPCPGDGDVQQPPLFLYGLCRSRVHDGHYALCQARQQDRVPLKPLGGVHRGQGHRRGDRRVAGLRALGELGGELRQGRRGPRGGQVVRESGDGGEGLPALPDRAAGGEAESPAEASTCLTAAGSSPGSPVASVPAPAARAAPRSSTSAFRTSGRS